MTRKDFLKNIGVGAAFVLTVPCLHSCDKDDEGMTPQPGSVDFTLDLDDTANQALTTPGGFVISNRVVVAQTLSGEFIAASQVCSHEATQAVIYDSANEQWFCGTHGARFDQASGDPENGITNNPLRLYNVSRNANILRITG
jgi:nitrite reductase/ring-hydroxylating ferredoxin subunit